MARSMPPEEKTHVYVGDNMVEFLGACFWLGVGRHKIFWRYSLLDVVVSPGAVMILNGNGSGSYVTIHPVFDAN